MKRLVPVVALAVAATGLVAPAAQAAPTRDLYMVQDVENFNGVYVGEFAALRKKGKRVVGAVGAFGSEYTCLRGKVTGGKLRGAYYEDGQVAGRFTRKWVGRGSTQRIKGMTSSTWGDMRVYLGSNPTRFIRTCIDLT
jgi:hypothetical protein